MGGGGLEEQKEMKAIEQVVSAARYAESPFDADKWCISHTSYALSICVGRQFRLLKMVSFPAVV